MCFMTLMPLLSSIQFVTQLCLLTNVFISLLNKLLFVDWVLHCLSLDCHMTVTCDLSCRMQFPEVLWSLIPSELEWKFSFLQCLHFCQLSFHLFGSHFVFHHSMQIINKTSHFNCIAPRPIVFLWVEIKWTLCKYYNILIAIATSCIALVLS